MNSRTAIFTGSVILFVFLVVSCASGPVTKPTTPPSTEAEIARSATETWQQKWDKLVAEAKKEGKVVIGSSAGAPVREAFGKAFAGNYGVSLEYISGKPAELVPKVQAERRAGLYLVDLFIAGTGTVVPLLGPEGALEPLDNVLLLPEVLDKKAWWGGDLPWADTNHLQVQFFAFAQDTLTINTDLVKSDEIKSFRELLNPKWHGKISLLDPTMAGGGNSFFTFAVEALGLDYLRELGNREPAVAKDRRLQAEWLARGKYPVGIGVQDEMITEFIKAGAPIKLKPVIEGTILESAGGGLALMNKAPHPKAAMLFINWLLSREGQTVASKAYGLQSAREDVPTDFLLPDRVRQPGVKYYSLIGEGPEIRKREAMKLAKEMYGHLLK